jgi:hypothetical protein
MAEFLLTTHPNCNLAPVFGKCGRVGSNTWPGLALKPAQSTGQSESPGQRDGSTKGKRAPDDFMTATFL